MNDIKELSKTSAKSFRDELQKVTSIKRLLFSDSLNLFSQLVSAKNYSEMMHSVGRGQCPFLQTPSLTEIVKKLNQRGAKTSNLLVSQALINAVGKENIHVFFPFLFRAVANVHDANTQTIIVNFRNVGLVNSELYGYISIGKHTLKGNETSDAQIFITALLGQTEEESQKIIYSNEETTSRLESKVTLEIIYSNGFSTDLANQLVLSIQSYLGEDFPEIRFLDKLNDRKEIEFLLTDTLHRRYINKTFSSWENNIGRLFVNSLAESIDNEIRCFDTKFNWNISNLEPIIRYTKYHLLETLELLDLAI